MRDKWRGKCRPEQPWTQWMVRAASNLARARQGRQCEEVLFEDLCFDAQQAAEKALKALLIFFGCKAPRTHSIGYLMRLIEDRICVPIPPDVRPAVILSDYAVTTRYPGDWEPVDEDEYNEAVKLAGRVYQWVLDTIQLHD